MILKTFLCCCNGIDHVLFQQARELAITILWKDYRQVSAVKFLRLEDFLDDQRHGLTIDLDPQGILFAEVHFRPSNATFVSSLDVTYLIISQGLLVLKVDEFRICKALYYYYYYCSLNSCV